MQIAAVVENVGVICDFVVAAAREAGFDERALHHCRLAVDEACTNVVEHGYAPFQPGSDDCAPQVTVTCGQQHGYFLIQIEDTGAPFDPTSQPDPDLNELFDQHKPGGWGIYFIKKMMDQVEYIRRDGCNILVLGKRLPAVPVPVPPPEPASVAVIELSPKVALVQPKGHLDALHAKPLDAALQHEIGHGRRGLILDLREVDYLSSAGIKVLVAARQRAHDAKGELVLCCFQPRVLEILQVVGMDLVFTLYATQEAALQHFRITR
ncbi:MAG: anti-sigma factor antagonist [bacterium]|nr:anti-sigma factor antagonist [bacterium]